MIGDNSLPDYPSLRACRDIQLIANPVATVAPELTNFRLEEKNETLTTLYYLSPPKPHLHKVHGTTFGTQGAWYYVWALSPPKPHLHKVHGTTFGRRSGDGQLRSTDYGFSGTSGKSSNTARIGR